jgi:hypothetical protein
MALELLVADHRESLNERFAARLRGGARIDVAAFFTHLRETVEPLLQAVHAHFAERSPAVLTALYDASLDLFAASLLGPETKLPAMLRVWTDLLPNAVGLLAREPVSLVGCLCNALYQVAQQRGTQIDLWLKRMRMLLPLCSSLAEVVDAGSVTAWQAGMPQYRVPALETSARMKPKIASIALGLAEDTALSAIIESLTQNRWFRIPSAGEASSSTGLLPVGQAGAFIGFGGLFSHTPKVRCSGERLIVSVDDRIHWQMIGDAYGVWFRRIEESKIKPAPLPKDISVDAQGALRWGRTTCKAPYLAESNSIACDGETLAVTIPTSHHVFLFAQTGAAA